jgi:hypothetical protein
MTGPNTAEEKKELFLAIIEDVISDYLYYDRKNDDDLSIGDVNGLIESGCVTIDDVIDKFTTYLKECLSNNYDCYYEQHPEGKVKIT